MTWTDENVTELTRLWDAGYSASQIGKRIGLSKNAVIGKAHRLGLKPRPSPIKRSLIARPPAPPPRVELEPAAPEPPPMPMPPTPQEARDGPSCVWPIGEPGDESFHFCGQPALPNKPYCSQHCAKAYISRKSEAA